MHRLRGLLPLLVLLLLVPSAALRAGEDQIVDEGTAGQPHSPSTGAIPYDSSDVSYGGVADALGGRFNSSQVSSVLEMANNSLGIDLGSLQTGGMTGQNVQMLQWTAPNTQPESPTTNWETATGTTADGWTVTIHTQITGPDGTYGSTDGGGGTGTAWIGITDADGNTNWLMVCVTGGEIVYQNFHAEQLVRDNADVQIDGPDAVNEDTSATWSVSMPDSNLPPETPDQFDVQWAGAIAATWTAAPGDPAMGQGAQFSTTFHGPGTGLVTVEAERAYSFKVFRAEPNPAYVEGESPIEEAFLQVETPMTGLIRGSTAKNVAVADVTPPEVTLRLTASHEDNEVALTEAPLDLTPPKTMALALAGRNLSLDVGTPVSLDGLTVPAGLPVVVGPDLDPTLAGFVVRVHERFAISALCNDNFTPRGDLNPHWSLVNETTGAELLPDGQVPYGLVRIANEPGGDRLTLTTVVADAAGNTTTLVVPVRVLGQDMTVRTMDLDGRRQR